MDQDKAAILKIVIALALILVFLVVWFLTIGAPAGDEEEEAVEASIEVGNAISSWFALS